MNNKGQLIKLPLFFMKQWLRIFILIFLLQACTKPEKPEAVALHFITAMQQEDFNKAKDYATSESANLLDGLNITKGKQLFPLKPGDIITVKKIIQKDDTCFVFVTTQKNFPFKLVLQKDGRSWKVAYDMQTLMKSAFDEAP